MYRLVLDTSIVVAALRSHRGPASAILTAVANRKYTAVATPPLFLEYEDVLKRPEHRLAHGLSIAQVDDFLTQFAAVLQPVEVYYKWRPQLRDASDEMVLEAAINGRANAIVTYNVADFLPASKFFTIAVISPPDFLKRRPL
jgi:putative PIN family toxin of toxin-antitoxin system